MKTVLRFASAAAVYMLSVFFCFFGTMSAAAYEAATAEIPFDCFIGSASDTETYRIKLEAVTEGAPVPESDILEVSIAEEKFEVALTSPGTFMYRIYEIAGDDEGIEYDANIYTVALFVENDGDDRLSYTVVANAGDGSSKSASIKFKNIVLGDNVTFTTVPETSTVTTASETTATTAATTTTSAAAAQNESGSVSGDKITKIVGAVMTGDSFPAHAVRSVLIVSFAAAIITFLFRRKNSEEEEKNNE